MLTSNDLKDWLHRCHLSSQDKLLLILATREKPEKPAGIINCAKEAGFKIPAKWNISQTLNRSKGKAVNLPDGWELTETGKKHLRDLGVSKISPAAMQVAGDFRAYLDSITDIQTRAFVEEAIKCHEAELYRASIVMSWLGAVDVLHKYVCANKLLEFNAEAKRLKGKKWKEAKSPDDLGKMRESDFLDRLEGLSIIGKGVKTELKKALDLRNNCSHPNTLQVSVHQSAAHIEFLLKNVFNKY